VYSAGRLALSRAYGVPDVHCGAPVSLLPYLAQRTTPLAQVTLKSSRRQSEEAEVAGHVLIEDDVQNAQPRKKMMMA
jgi:hypothetical protein